MVRELLYSGLIEVKERVKNKADDYFMGFIVDSIKKVTTTFERRVCEEALQKFIQASPTEEIANAWSYEIKRTPYTTSLIFNNSVIQNGENVAIIIDVGHMTKSGNWVEGTHYLDKATQEAYDQIIYETWEALKNERN